eukprot:730346-Heterocapsa_arctica.AAC.1
MVLRAAQGTAESRGKACKVAGRQSCPSNGYWGSRGEQRRKGKRKRATQSAVRWEVEVCR